MSASRLVASEPERALCALLELVLPLLGTAHTTKCVVETDDKSSSVFVKDAYILLQSLNIEHPVGQVILEVCKAHKELYGCGVKSLLFFLSHLYKTVEGLRKEGVPLLCSQELLHEALEDCVRELEKIAVPVQVQKGTAERNTAEPSLSSSNLGCSQIISASSIAFSNDLSCSGAMSSQRGSQSYAMSSLPVTSGKSSVSDGHAMPVAVSGSTTATGGVNHATCYRQCISPTSSSPTNTERISRTPAASRLLGTCVKSAVPTGLVSHSCSRGTTSAVSPLASINQTLSVLSLLPGKQRKSNLHHRVMQSSRHFSVGDVDNTESHERSLNNTSQAASEMIRVDSSKPCRSEVLSSNDVNTLTPGGPCGPWPTGTSRSQRVKQLSSRGPPTYFSGGCHEAKLVKENVSIEKFFEEFGGDKGNLSVQCDAATDRQASQQSNSGSFSDFVHENSRLGPLTCGEVPASISSSSSEPSAWSTVEAGKAMLQKQGENISNPVKRGCLPLAGESGRHSWDTACPGFISRQVNSSRPESSGGLCFQYGPLEPSDLEGITLPKDSLCLCHGCEEAMSFASSMMSHQFLDHKDLQEFDLNRLHTCCITGTSKSKEVVEGLVLNVDQQVLEMVSKSRDGTFSALLVNADLTPGAHHKGFKQTLNAKEIISVEDLTKEGPSWASDVMSVFCQLGISSVLVKGRADPALKDQCFERDIVVFEMVPYHALVVLQSACKAELIIYPMDATSTNVCSGIRFSPLHGRWMDKISKEKTHVVLKCPGVHVQTLVIKHPSPAWRDVLEQEFWACANRLAQAVKDGVVLPGGGSAEEFCGRYLTENTSKEDEGEVGENEDMVLYRPVVRAALAETFAAYSRVVRNNRSKSNVGDTESFSPDGPRNPRCRSDSILREVSTPAVRTCEQNVLDLIPSRPDRQFDPMSDRGKFIDCSQNSVSNLGHAFTKAPRFSAFTKSGFLPLEDDSSEFDDLFSGITPLPSADDFTVKPETQLETAIPSKSRIKLDEVFSRSEENLESISPAFGPGKNALLFSPADKNIPEANSQSSDCQYFERQKNSYSSAQTKKDVSRCFSSIAIHPCSEQTYCALDTASPTNFGVLKPSERSDFSVDYNGRQKQHDNFKSKVSAWRSAVSCVCMLMKVDTLIRTGVDKETTPVDSVLL